jgi:hypothetical protein
LNKTLNWKPSCDLLSTLVLTLAIRTFFSETPEDDAEVDPDVFLRGEDFEF